MNFDRGRHDADDDDDDGDGYGGDDYDGGGKMVLSAYDLDYSVDFLY